ncbi:hypothetical protein MKZ48_21285 [Pseudoalteromonas shioyasakiensis]|nr:hypothetical protein [Pseudoalteromonas shioyasakiensis]NUJ32907.1 hypothetical protein [Pseudoalteromonas sp. 2103]
MSTKNKIILLLVLVAIAITLRSTIGFSNLMDTIVLGFFVLFGCWFSYDNHKKKEATNNAR